MLRCFIHIIIYTYRRHIQNNKVFPFHCHFLCIYKEDYKSRLPSIFENVKLRALLFVVKKYELNKIDDFGHRTVPLGI